MKRLIFMLFALCLVLTACGGNISNTQRIYAASMYHTEAEIESAMDVALEHFAREFECCTMTSIRYEESRNGLSASEWAQQYGDTQGIVLISSFHVGPSGGDGSLNPNSTYNNWKWILTKSNDGEWILRTWGYG